MLLPKPIGDNRLRRPRPHPAQSALDYIRRMLAGADLLDVETKNDMGPATRWLLVPVGDAELEWLAAFDAETTDLEDEVAVGELDTADDEPSIGWTGGIDQADPYRTNNSTDREDDESDYEPGNDDEPNQPPVLDWQFTPALRRRKGPPGALPVLATNDTVAS